MDYIVYAALQLAKDEEAKAVLDGVRSIDKIDAEHSAAAFAFTAIPARYAMERQKWAEAADLKPPPPEPVVAEVPARASSTPLVCAGRGRRPWRQHRERQG